MIRRKLAATAALAVATALLATGCSRSAGTSADTASDLSSGPAKGSITVWAQGTEGEALTDFIKPFEKANPDVTVTVTPIPWDSAQNKYQTAIAGGTTPDIGMIGTDWMPSFASAFRAAPKAISTSGMFPENVKSVTVDGTVLGVPWYVETRVIFYRSDLMKQAGFDTFPTTWDGFTKLAQAYKEKAGATYAISLPVGGWNSFLGVMPFAWSNGASLLADGDSKWTIDTPEVTGGLDYVDGLFQSGLANRNPDSEANATSSNFVNGSVPMFLSGPWDIPGLKTAGGAGFEDKFAVAKIPASPTGTSTSLAAGSNLTVFKGSKNPDAAWKLIQWLTKPDVQVQWFKKVNDLPSQQSAWKDPALTSDPKVATFGEQLKNAIGLPSLQTWTQVSAAGDTEYEKIVRGGQDVGTGLAAIQSTAESLGTAK